MKKLALFIIAFISMLQLQAQNGVAISTSSSATPDASAILDVQSVNGDQGMLIPRVDISDLSTAAPVTTPATSLLVYNTNSTTGPGFFYWDGSVWVSATGAKKLDDLSDATSSFYDLFLGYKSGESATLNNTNTGIGPYSLQSVSGGQNTAVGKASGRYLTSGSNNTYVGYYSGHDATTGSNNVFLGRGAGSTVTTGESSILIGYNVETSSTTASNEINIGNALYGTNIYPASGTSAHIGINTQTPDASASLDIASTTSGLLIPRMAQTLRDAISTPAEGLLIYQTDAPIGFYYYSGGAWQSLASTANPNMVSIDSLTDARRTASTLFLGNAGVNLDTTGTNYDGDNNVFVGITAGEAMVNGHDNVAVGQDALTTNTGGVFNAAFGFEALKVNTGSYNTAIGSSALYTNTTGTHNIAIGTWASVSSSTASNEMNIGSTIYATSLYGATAKVGIGYGNNAPAATLDVKGDVKVATSVSIGTILHLTPLSSAPSSPSNGDVYVGTDNHIYCYLSGAWKQLDN